MLELVQIQNPVVRCVVPPDADVTGRENLAQLVAHEVDDALEVERSGDALLDAVDHRQLGVALLGFLQQSLRLVEQASVLQRHAHAGGDGGQQALIRFAKRVVAIVVLERDEAERAVSRENRRGDARPALVGTLDGT